MLNALLWFVVVAELPVAVSSAEVQIGEPIVCTVELDLVDGAQPTLSEEEMEPGRGWIVLDPPKLRRTEGGANVLTWTVLALEPEPGALPRPVLLREDAALELVTPHITVAPALAEGEDAPRPARGFHVPPPAVSLSSTKVWLFALLGAALLSLVAWIMVKRRRRPELALEPSPAERLASLGPATEGGGPEFVAWHGELTRILRSAYSDDQAGWSDEEWVERADLTQAQRAELREVLTSCAAVKYGGARPTSFAVEETLERARELVCQAEEVAA